MTTNKDKDNDLEALYDLEWIDPITLTEQEHEVLKNEFVIEPKSYELDTMFDCNLITLLALNYDYRLRH